MVDEDLEGSVESKASAAGVGELSAVPEAPGVTQDHGDRENRPPKVAPNLAKGLAKARPPAPPLRFPKAKAGAPVDGEAAGKKESGAAGGAGPAAVVEKRIQLRSGRLVGKPSARTSGEGGGPGKDQDQAQSMDSAAAIAEDLVVEATGTTDGQVRGRGQERERRGGAGDTPTEAGEEVEEEETSESPGAQTPASVTTSSGTSASASGGKRQYKPPSVRTTPDSASGGGSGGSSVSADISRSQERLGTGTPTQSQRWSMAVGNPGEDLVSAHKKVRGPAPVPIPSPSPFASARPRLTSCPPLLVTPHLLVLA